MGNSNSTSTDGTQVWDENHNIWVQNPANGTVWDPDTSTWVPVPSDPMSMPDWYNATYEEPLNCTNPTCLKEDKESDDGIAIGISSAGGPMALILAFVVISRVWCSLAGKWEARRSLKRLRRTERMLENGDGKLEEAANEQSRPAVESIESDTSSSSMTTLAGDGGYGVPPVYADAQRRNIDTEDATQGADPRLRGIDSNRTGSGYPSSDHNSESTLPCSSELGSENSESTMI